MIPYIETHIEDACNLKCRGCSHFSVFAKSHRKDLEEFRREFTRLAEIESIPVIRIMGGEPLLNPDFVEYCRIARQCFPDSKIVLVTNGILRDKLDLHRAELRDLNINITVSDYHLTDTSGYSEVHEKGQLYNISLDPSGSQDPDRAFAGCDIRINQWFFFQDGRMYPCCIAGTIHDFWEHFGLDWGFTPEDMSIDIFTHTAEEIEEFIHKPIALCRYCDTARRTHTYKPFERSKGEMSEWICQ